MVKGALVDRLTRVGRRLVELMDETGMEVTSALWLYRPESGDWVLILASPEVESLGPRAVYEKIQKVFSEKRIELGPLTLEDVVAKGPNEPLLKILGRVVRTGSGITEIRFTSNRINNTFIEDALIYRMR